MTALHHRSKLLPVLALGLLALVLQRTPAAATCLCGRTFTVSYYSDASHRTLIGRCNFACSGEITCTGSKSTYFTSSPLGCCGCNPAAAPGDASYRAGDSTCPASHGLPPWAAPVESASTEWDPPPSRTTSR
jgi:hypothetical protein